MENDERTGSRYSPCITGLAFLVMVAALSITIVGWSGKPNRPVLLKGYIGELEKRIDEKERVKERRTIRPGFKEVKYTAKITNPVSTLGVDLRAVLGDGAEEETRTRESIINQVGPRFSRLLDYHTIELEKYPDLPSGVLTTCLHISPEGKTYDIEIIDGDERRSNLKRAIIEDIRGWQLEPAKSDVFVVCNLVFYRSNDDEEEEKWGKPFRRYWYNSLYGPNLRDARIEVVADDEFDWRIYSEKRKQ